MNASVPDRLAELQRRFLEGLERRLTEMAALLDAPAAALSIMLALGTPVRTKDFSQSAVDAPRILPVSM